ncbi:AraC family transcriptional regulator [Polaribacter aestuariivivens]|uniref:AraC family transcriptional regulator n=1 Tax=Polaribacter aestuariivivens TaxID=2304626 RepID=A0A5S3N8R2_9FLAO|nr:helix-turn-helix domain-containing protein [Polaribacter aestuariivivens]TMM31482.1 AraC family transcriptional regulator [Polaribacter aestuariivivens]
MKLSYFDTSKISHLITEFYTLSFSESIVPYSTTIIPFGFTGATFIYDDGQKAVQNNKETVLKNLVLNGQFYKPYKFCVQKSGESCGLNFKPTGLYKLTELDVSQFTNKHLYFEKIDKFLNNKLSPIFINYKNNKEKLFSELEKTLLSLPLHETKYTEIIDVLIDKIHESKGMLSVTSLLKTLPIGQKTLETKFKMIVGLTPGKYIRLHRFINLMRKYEQQEIDLKDLIYTYDYYDEAHFYKDFKLFTSQSPKKYFNSEYAIIKKALKNN